MNKKTGPSLVSTLTATLPKAKVKTVAKTLQDLEAEPLLDIMAATLLKVVAKAFADKQVSLETKVPVKAKADTFAVVQGYANINTPNKVVSDALAIRRLTGFSTSAGQKRCLHTDMQQEIEFETRESRSVGRNIR